jgi:energy-coupling factor transporter ATP-binding protein EcfA2
MISFDHVSYSYPDTPYPALTDVSFTLPEGEITLVTGPSGAGKSTLLRCLNGLVPHFSGGTLKGTLSVCGLNPVMTSPRVMSGYVGFVFQDPESQFVMDHVEAEIAFALENAALPRAEMLNRVQEVMALLDLTALRTRSIDTLSGGEKQRVAIAAALALHPQVLVLDEPTSQLSPESAHEVLTAVAHINITLGITVLLAEHRLERILPFAHRMLHMRGRGKEVLVGEPREILSQISQTPPLIHLAKALDWKPLPVTIEEGCKFSRDLAVKGPLPATVHIMPGGQPFIETESLSFAYGNRPALRGVNIQLFPGEVVALLGQNGAGKTTLLKCLIGLLRPSAGSVKVAGRDIAGKEVADICRDVGYLPQDPNALLFADTVAEELHITLRNHNIALRDAPVSSQMLLERLGLLDKSTTYPRDLSVGERQRVALGAILVTQPKALLLDEPTRGLDYEPKQALSRLLRQWREEGLAVLLVTHDVEFAATVADRALLMQEAEITAQGSVAEVLSLSSQYATQISQLFPGTGWLTAKDALVGLGIENAAGV